MKKIIFVFFILTLSACSYNNISNSLYISSIHLSYNEQEAKYEGKFCLTSSDTIGKTEGSVGTSQIEVATQEGKSILELFTMLKASSDLFVNYRHLSSVIFHTSFWTEENIEEFLNIIKFYNEFDFNFYVFLTEISGDDFFDLKNPDKISLLYSLVNSPATKDCFYFLEGPVHFLKFARDYYNKDKILKIPVIVLKKVWKIDKEESTSLSIEGVCVGVKDYQLFFYEENHNLIFFHDFLDFVYTAEGKSFLISNFDYEEKYKSDFQISISCTYIPINSLKGKEAEDFLKSVIEQEIDRGIDMFLEKGIDYLNIQDINKKFKKQYTYESIKVNISFNR